MSATSLESLDDLLARADSAAALLEAIASDRTVLAGLDPERRRRLLAAVGRAAQPEAADERRLAKALRKKERRDRRAADERLLDRTGMRGLRAQPVFPTPLRAPRTPPAFPAHFVAEPGPEDPPVELADERTCYVCKTGYRTVHAFYDQLCPTCGDENFAKRAPTARLDGRFALVTGARVKIGYHAAILLLRAGATVVVTTRFPHDAALRYASEADYGAWKDRLVVHGLDLVHTPSVERFARHLEASLPQLDFILNNACQTVRRPAGFYAHLAPAEESLALPAAARAVVGERFGQAPLVLASGEGEGPRDAMLFPSGRLDADRQQVDLREINSWRLPLADVPTIELLEVHLVNAVAPFVLNARLKPLMLRRASRDKHIVNVSAMEGQFYRAFKTDKHPHTNMAKASLNMMTRTSSSDYVKDGIHMNSVDTGWITDEDPAPIAARKVAVHRFSPPLDVVDGAARIVDPIFSGIATGRHAWGQFFKDYRPAPW